MWERGSGGAGGDPDGKAGAFGQRDGGLESLFRVGAGAEDERRVGGAVECGDEGLDGLRGDDGGPVHGTLEQEGLRGVVRGLGPVVEGHGQVDDAAWGGVGEHESLGHQRGGVLGAQGFACPLHERLGELDGVDVGEQGADRYVASGLLAGHHDHRCVAGLGVGHAPHRVAASGGGVQIREADAARGLCESVRHRDDGALLQAEVVGNVVRKPGQERQLVRPRIAEDSLDSVMTEHPVERLVDGRHGRVCPLGGCLFNPLGGCLSSPPRP